MTLPDTAQPYWRRQQAINASAVAIVLRAWQLSGGDPDRWLAALPLVVATITRAQTAVAGSAAEFIEATLAELGITAAPLAVVNPAPLVGVSGAGVPLATLYAGLPDQFAVHAGRAAAQLDTAAPNPGPLSLTALQALPVTVFQQAMAATASQLEANVQTVISDTGRAAESLSIAVRPGIGYVRMLNPPSCKRCVVQAGKFFRWNAGFKRHPRCDCRHIPSTESTAHDLRVDPNRYFGNLTTAEQDAAFGKAGAQAIRGGADISQVVNSDRGLQTVQVYGQRLAITTEGVTKRGQAGRVIRARGRSAATTPRLMPSSIYEIADDRDEALRLLGMNGYLADGAPAPRSPRRTAPVAPSTASPDTAGGTPGGPPPVLPPRGSTAAGDEPEGWSGHVKGYVHPHRAEVWTEAERVRRQEALGAVPAGEQLHQHEIETVERLQAAGETVEWIPKDSVTFRPTNDINWVNKERAAELKSTGASYALVSQLIRRTVQRAVAADVTKDTFIIDIGPARLTQKLRTQLGKYNQRNPRNGIQELWVVARDEIKSIDLQ